MFILIVSKNLKQNKIKQTKKIRSFRSVIDCRCSCASNTFSPNSVALLFFFFLFCFLNRDVGRSACRTVVDVPSADNQEVPHMKSSDLSFVVQSNGAALVLGSE